MAVFTVLRAAFGYLFLVFMVRIVGRRPGKQLTPFEFVLIFFLGGLTLTGIVGMEMSLTNAICQIFTIAVCHYGLSCLRRASQTAAKILDGTPLLLMADGKWRSHTMSEKLIQDDDVMDMAREQGIRDFSGIRAAVLETLGHISIIPAEKQKGESTEESGNAG